MWEDSLSPAFLNMQDTPKGLVWGKLRLNEAGAVEKEEQKWGASLFSSQWIGELIACLLSPIVLLPEWENGDLFG